MEEQKLEQRYTEEEMMAKLGKSRITLWRYRHKRQLGYYRIGANVEYGESHLRDFLARCERKARGATNG